MELTGRHAGDSRPGRNIACDDRSGTDERPSTDPHSSEDHAARAEAGSFLDDRAKKRPVVCGLQAAVLGGRTRGLVVDEEDAVPDEDLVVDVDSFADEAVALDLAAGTHARASLNLDKRPDPRTRADRAAVEIRERPDVHVVPEGHIVEQPKRGVVDGAVSHRRTRARRR